MGKLMSWLKLQGIILAIALLYNNGSAVAQQRSALKPSPDLFAADIDKLIEDLKAAKASKNQLSSAEVIYNSAKAAGLCRPLLHLTMCRLADHRVAYLDGFSTNP